MDKKFRLSLRNNTFALKNSNKDFESIYNIMFGDDSLLLDFVFCEQLDGYRIKSLTYKQMSQRIRSIAGGIREACGDAHQYIGIDLDNSPDWVACFWAILMSGNKPFLINNRHPLALEEGMFKTLNIQYIIGKDTTIYSPALLNVDKLAAFCCSANESFTFENEFALPTSATSLSEKICIYTGSEIATQILNTPQIVAENKNIAASYKGHIKHLCFLPFYHIFGLSAVYFWFSFFGATLVFLKDYSADTILKTCRRHEATHIFAVPLLWHTVEKQLMREVKKTGDKQEQKFNKGVAMCTKLQNIFPSFGNKIAKRVFKDVHKKLFGDSVRFCISGGSYINDSTLHTLNAIGLPLYNGFGMSEIGITSVELRNKPKYRSLNSIGRPFSQVEYKISDEGTLLVRSRSVCRHMIINGQRITTVQGDEWFDTGDYVRTDEHGYYYILGRRSDVIIGENGENINPDLLEKQFAAHINQPFCIIKSESESAQQVPAIIIQINKYANVAYLHNIIKIVYDLNEALPMASRIREFYFTDNEIVSKTAVKVSRQYVRRGIDNGTIVLMPFAEVQEKQPEAFDENNALAIKIKEIIAKDLNKQPDEIGVDMHLVFDLGATSLDYFAIIANLNTEFEVSLRLDETNSCYTVRSFYEVISSELSGGN